MPRYAISYFYLATGMEGIADTQDYGEETAPTPEQAKDQAARRRHPTSSEGNINWVKGCLTAKELPPRNEWKDRVIDALIVTWAYKAEHEDDPKLAVNDLIISEIRMATDPVISKPQHDALKAAFEAGWKARSTPVAETYAPEFPGSQEQAWEVYYQELQK